MLQKVILCNFVCFKEEFSIKFGESGVYFFMGGNSTGKTCVFEAIRNCLKTTDLKQASSRCDPELNSFVVSYFCTDVYEIASIYFDDVKRKEILKILMAKDNQEDIKVYVARRSSVREPRSNGWKLLHLELAGAVEGSVKDVKTNVEKAFENLKKDGNFNVLDLSKLLSKLLFQELKMPKTDSAFFDDFIEKFVSIQMTLPHRGINPAQSTYADANQFQESSEGADVLKWYLEQPDDSLLGIFHQLSNGEKYTLNNENGTIEITICNTGKKVPVLRVPEAVVEGHVASVLLCGPKPTTLCLDDPSRGMDRQTTKVFCDTLKQLDHQKRELYSHEKQLDGQSKQLEGHKKLVIVATNDPYFISPWNLPNSYIFCDKGSECKIFSGQKLLSMRSDVCDIDVKVKRSDVCVIDEKVKRSITSYPLSLIWFSKRVFFVEGLSDRMFVEAIRDIIVREGTRIGRDLLDRAGLRTDLLQRLQQFLTSLTIINLQGESNKQKAEKVCDFLEMRDNKKTRYYLLDQDTLSDINKTLSLNFGVDNPSFTELAEKGVFIWSHDLEIEVASFCYAENLKDLLTENHVPVTKDEPFQLKKRKLKGKTKSKKAKLFLESPDITEVNIHKIVSGILNAINLGKERQKDHKIGGTVPMFLKFILIAMLESIDQGDKLKWEGEDYLA